MNANAQNPPAGNRERTITVLSGWLMLPVVLTLFFGSIAAFIYSLAAGAKNYGAPIWPLFIISLLVLILSIFLFPGFFTLQPNEARVLILFGAYKGTVRVPGFHWGNPFYANGPSSGVAAAQMMKVEMGQSVGAHGAAAATRTKSSRHKVSLRSRNFNSERLKVNDKRGNPIEIAAVVVWRVEDTAQATFDVDDYENYVRVQSESAIRHLARYKALTEGK